MGAKLSSTKDILGGGPSITASARYEPGQKLRRARERLGLRYRDVEEASQRIAERRRNDEFSIGLSRLADIENRGTLPSLFRLYTLCAIYRIEFNKVLQWYGIDVEQMFGDAAATQTGQTHLIDFEPSDDRCVELPTLSGQTDLCRTDYLHGHIKDWGKVPLCFLSSLDLRHQRYGFIGLDDWSMYPVLSPGSFVQVDESKRKISNQGWADEFERPVYFLEHRGGFRCCWCVEQQGLLILQAHSSSAVVPEIFKPSEIDVIGQVVGVAKRLNLGKRRHTRS